jgi:transcriptional regulator with XRE-family HTH domain
MSRPRGSPPATPFGSWLAGWLADHPDWTFQALATEVGVTKSAISLWISAERQPKIRIERLRRLARVTGEPIENLERLVYGNQAERETASPLSPEILTAIRAEVASGVADGVVDVLRRLRDEGLLPELDTSPRPPPRAPRRESRP